MLLSILTNNHQSSYKENLTAVSKLNQTILEDCSCFDVYIAHGKKDYLLYHLIVCHETKESKNKNNIT